MRKASVSLLVGALAVSLIACTPAAPNPTPTPDVAPTPEPVTVFESTTGETPEARAAMSLGNTFSYERIAAPILDAAQVDLTPNANKVTDGGDGVVINGVRFEYDTMSGATVIPSRTEGEQKQSADAAVKADHMFWTVQPPLGITEGEYFRYEKKFNEKPDGYFLGTIDLVVKDGIIRHVEFDEYSSANYYNALWASQSKKRSGYAFFQAGVPRTDVTLVTSTNGQNFLEWQILHHNSLDLIFDTPYGNTNSARDAFIPAARELAALVHEPSGKYYIGIALPNGDGITSWLQLVYEGKQLVDVRYDEVFADRQSDVADPALQAYYRQSKYQSVYYAEFDNGTFREWADKLASAMITENTIDLSGSAFASLKEMSEFAHVEALAAKVAPVVEKYFKEGYTHNIGTINKRPAYMVERPDQIDRNADIVMTLVGDGVYNEDKTHCVYTLEVENVSTTDYELDAADFYLYVKNEKNVFDTLADPKAEVVVVPAGSKVTVSVDMAPIRPTDNSFSLRYDGNNKVFRSFSIPDVQ